jgi:single-stranded-DNA-specific exonuclease
MQELMQRKNIGVMLMIYKLIEGSRNDKNNIIATVLQNRGIQNPNSYLHLDSSVVQDYNDLENMNTAVECFISHYNKRDKIILIPDEDSDGYTSSAMLYLYIKSLDSDYPVEYILHSHPKQHGLANIDLHKFDGAGLAIIADAGTNDANECNKLIEQGIDIIILDHHDANYQDESEEEVNYQTAEHNKAIIVNNQLSPEYSNKDLSGAGIVYRFLQALDEELWEAHADDFLDLCAVGNIADVMDIRNFETRYFINQGIASFKNKFLVALAKAQEYSMHGEITVHNIAWYIAPVINSITRIGSPEERELVFKAMTEQDEMFAYNKRGVGLVDESIYDRAARIAKNAKSRQDKQRDKVFNELRDQADLSEKVVFLESKQATTGLVGLSAMKLADTLKRPVIIVKGITKDGEQILSGSCRNYDGSPIPNLKDLILSTNSFIFCSGHGNAAGLAIKRENVNEAKNKFAELLSLVDFNPTIPCDFVFDVDDLDIGFIQTIDKYSWLWGTGIKEPKVAVENVVICREDIHIQGKNFNSIAFTNNDIKFVKFNMKEDDPLLEWASAWDGDNSDKITINVVGTVGINEFQGVYTPQFIIEDSEIIK